MRTRLAILLLAALCWGASPAGPSACAQSPYLAGSWWLYGGGYAGGSWWEQLPYFAVFPPVYYRGITPRTYGCSPFAWGGDASEAEPSGAAPLVVINQYVARNATLLTPANAGAAAPVLVKNPYVRRGADGKPATEGQPEGVPKPPRPGESSPPKADG